MSSILTVLHKTSSFLPRVLPVHSLKLSTDLLLNAFQDLSSTTPRPANLAVYSVDQWSGAQDLITALLQDPLTSNQSQNNRIRTRWQTSATQHQLTIS
jgi:hypothetical protein